MRLHSTFLPALLCVICFFGCSREDSKNDLEQLRKENEALKKRVEDLEKKKASDNSEADVKLTQIKERLPKIFERALASFVNREKVPGFSEVLDPSCEVLAVTRLNNNDAKITFELKFTLKIAGVGTYPATKTAGKNCFTIFLHEYGGKWVTQRYDCDWATDANGGLKGLVQDIMMGIDNISD